MISNYQGYSPQQHNPVNRSNSLQANNTDSKTFSDQNSNDFANNLAEILPLLLQLIMALVQQLQRGNSNNVETAVNDTDTGESGSGNLSGLEELETTHNETLDQALSTRAIFYY